MQNLRQAPQLRHKIQHKDSAHATEIHSIAGSGRSRLDAEGGQFRFQLDVKVDDLGVVGTDKIPLVAFEWTRRRMRGVFYFWSPLADQGGVFFGNLTGVLAVELESEALVTGRWIRWDVRSCLSCF